MALENISEQINKTGIVNTIQPAVNKIVISILILIIGFILGRIARNLLKRLFSEMGINKFLTKILSFRANFEGFISGLIAAGIYIIAIIFSLNNVGITPFVIKYILYIILIIIVVMFLITTKSSIQNFFAGIIIRKRKKFRKGEHIKINTAEGIITNIGLLNIELSSENEKILVPYALFLKDNNQKKITDSKNIKKRI